MCVTVWAVASFASDRNVFLVNGSAAGLGGKRFLCSNFRVDGVLCSNQEGFDAVIKNRDVVGILRNVNSQEKCKSNF